MTAPTEAEIREAANAPVLTDSDEIGSLVYELLGPIRYLPPEEDSPGRSISAGCLWDDLRPSQAARLQDLLDGIYTKTDTLIQKEVIPRIRELVVEAALTFAAEYPDAPRAVREPVTA